MKKVYLTLALTLIVSLFYLGFAHAEMRSTAPVKSKIAIQQPKTESKVVLRHKDTFKNSNYDLEYSVTETLAGDLVLKVKNLKCSTCEIEDQKLKLDKSNRSLLAIKEASEKALASIVGSKAGDKKDSDDDKAEKRKEAQKKEKIKNCDLDKEGKIWKNSSDQVQCAVDRVSILIDSREEKDLALAQQIWDKIIRKNFENDIIAGKTDSAAINAVKEATAASGSDFSTLTLKNFGATTQAHGYYNASLQLRNQLQADITMANAHIASGNHPEAAALISKLNRNKLSYSQLTNHTTFAINELNKLANSPNGLQKNQYLAAHPEDAGLFDNGAAIITSTSKLDSAINQLTMSLNKVARSSGQPISTKDSFDFTVGNIGNSAGAAGVRGGTSNNLSNNNDSYFNREVSRIRGGHQLGDNMYSFDGAALPQFAPSVNFNQNQNLNNPLLNNNRSNPNSRGGTGLPRS